MRGAVLKSLVGATIALAGFAAVAAGPLERAREEAARAERRAEQLRSLAARARTDAARLEANSAALIAGIDATEARIDAAELALAGARRQRDAAKARLAERQLPLLQLGAAIQMLARRPPELALVQPGSAVDYARLKAAMASVEPVVAARTAALKRDVQAAEAFDRSVQQVAAARAGERDRLRARINALAALEREALQRSEALAHAAETESVRSLALGEEARERERAQGSRRFAANIEAALRDLPAPPLLPAERPMVEGPAIRLPVRGRVLVGTGEISPAGIHSRGLVIEAASHAAVAAPAAGKIAYAGRFRSFGEVVIIDHGGGWTSTITGLEALRVRGGQRVRSGDPIGRLGGQGAQIGFELRKNGLPQPVPPHLSYG